MISCLLVYHMGECWSPVGKLPRSAVVLSSESLGACPLPQRPLRGLVEACRALLDSCHRWLQKGQRGGDHCICR